MDTMLELARTRAENFAAFWGVARIYRLWNGGYYVTGSAPADMRATLVETFNAKGI